jgi:hypothetical protein
MRVATDGAAEYARCFRRPCRGSFVSVVVPVADATGYIPSSLRDYRDTLGWVTPLVMGFDIAPPAAGIL